jgi:hypothetical protein
MSGLTNGRLDKCQGWDKFQGQTNVRFMYRSMDKCRSDKCGSDKSCGIILSVSL